jgi:hypothetical protein
LIAYGFVELCWSLTFVAYLLPHMDASPPSTRRSGDANQFMGDVNQVKGGCDDDDDKRSPDAAALLFAKGSWFCRTSIGCRRRAAGLTFGVQHRSRQGRERRRRGGRGSRS